MDNTEEIEYDSPEYSPPPYYLRYLGDKTSRRPWKAIIGLIIYAGCNMLPFVMFYIYYKTVCGDVLSICLSFA